MPDHEQAMNKAKSQLTGTPTLAFCDIRKPTWLSTDVSRHGIGQQQTPTDK